MSEPAPAGARGKPPSTDRVLWRLYRTIFLRGRSTRLRGYERARSGIFESFGLTLLSYGLIGLLMLGLRGLPVAYVSLALHGFTFLFVGMFILAAAGEALFHPDEADILGHRPIPRGSMLRGKIAALAELALWIAVAFNVVGMFLGMAAPGGGVAFVPVHLLSLALSTAFTAGIVVLSFQLALRAVGRERLNSVMTTIQVVMLIAIIVLAQFGPQWLGRFAAKGAVPILPGWITLIPPFWFAGLDDALAGSHASIRWLSAGIGVVVTAAICWLAFDRLAGAEGGGQVLPVGERPARSGTSRRSPLRMLVDSPLGALIGDREARASFLLVSTYMVRDRELRLRIYPGLAALLIFPLVQLVGPGSGSRNADLGVIFSGLYMTIIPGTAMRTMRQSSQWKAAELFRFMPIAGPASLSRGMRRAVIALLAFPLLLLFAAIVLLVTRNPRVLLMLLPSALALPFYAALDALFRRGVPLSQPIDQTQGFDEFSRVLGTMAVGLPFAIGGFVAWKFGWFPWFLAAEILFLAVAGLLMHRKLDSVRWEPAIA